MKQSTGEPSTPEPILAIEQRCEECGHDMADHVAEQGCTFAWHITEGCMCGVVPTAVTATGPVDVAALRVLADQHAERASWESIGGGKRWYENTAAALRGAADQLETVPTRDQIADTLHDTWYHMVEREGRAAEFTDMADAVIAMFDSEPEG